MPSAELIIVIVLAAGAWFWLDSLHVREAAVQAARGACETEGLMFLDDTVAITSIRFGRDDAGHLKLQRAYEFEFSDTGDNRRKGSVVLLGRTVVVFNVGSRGPSLPQSLQ